MRRALLLSLFLLSISGAFCQQKPQTRFVRFATLYGKNYPFNRHPMSLSVLLFEAAEKKLIPAYHFDKLDKEPTPLAAELIHSRMKRVTTPWNETREYYEGDKVAYQGKTYVAHNLNVNSLPGLKDWTVIPDEYDQPWFLEIIGLDYQVMKGIPALQFVHLYRQSSDGPEYILSIAAQDAVNTLNNSGALWYNEQDQPLQHLVGDVFLFNEYDSEATIAQLLSKVDSSNRAKLTLPYKEYDKTELFLHFNQNKVDGYFFHHKADYGSQLELDTIPIPNLRQQIKDQNARIVRLGNALIDTTCVVFSKEFDKRSLSPLKNARLPMGDVSKIVRMSYVTSLAFDAQTLQKLRAIDNDKVTKLSAMIELIYEGLAAGTLKLHKSEALDAAFSPTEIPEQLVSQPPFEFEPWNAEIGYYEGDRVSQYGNYYQAIADSQGKSPEENAGLWRPSKVIPNLFQPNEVGRIHITYKVTLDQFGTVNKREPLHIQLLAYDWLLGIYKTLGYVSFGDLQAAVNKDPSVKQFLSSIIENNLGLFVMRDSKPLRAAK